MKSVLISIKPKYCELIVSGKKTVEVRKTKPKLQTPFKCYIYMTQGAYKDLGTYTEWIYKNRMKVIGEFVCDYIYPIEYGENPYGDYFYYELNNYNPIANRAKNPYETCLSFKELDDYLNRNHGYGWHVSDLKIYDEPKELWEMKAHCKEYGSENPKCDDCYYFIDGRGYEYDESDCGVGGRKPLKKPPQSWYYIEE